MAKQSLGTLIESFILAPDEKRDLKVTIPGAFTKDGQPLPFEITVHNEDRGPIAFDVRVVRGAKGVRVTCIVRKPTNGEAHEARDPRAAYEYSTR
jgi:hypothetical protein